MDLEVRDGREVEAAGDAVGRHKAIGRGEGSRWVCWCRALLARMVSRCELAMTRLRTRWMALSVRPTGRRPFWLSHGVQSSIFLRVCLGDAGCGKVLAGPGPAADDVHTKERPDCGATEEGLSVWSSA